MTERIEFSVNDRAVSVEVPPATPLLLVLRNDLNMRATRHGCGEGECGACTVLLNGQPVMACDTPVEAAAGHQIRTVESLADAQPRHPLVEAVIAEQAGQCGYCLAGILMRATALLESGEPIDRASICAALEHNLCRCGAHNRIIRAIERAAGAVETEAPA